MNDLSVDRTVIVDQYAKVIAVLYVPIPSANGSNEENLRDGKAVD